MQSSLITNKVLLLTHHLPPSSRQRRAVVPGPAGPAHRPPGDRDRGPRREELGGLQQRPERHQPGGVGLHDDRRPLLRQRGQLGRGPLPALRLVGGEERNAVDGWLDGWTSAKVNVSL